MERASRTPADAGQGDRAAGEHDRVRHTRRRGETTPSRRVRLAGVMQSNRIDTASADACYRPRDRRAPVGTTDSNPAMYPRAHLIPRNAPSRGGAAARIGTNKRRRHRDGSTFCSAGDDTKSTATDLSASKSPTFAGSLATRCSSAGRLREPNSIDVRRLRSSTGRGAGPSRVPKAGARRIGVALSGSGRMPRSRAAEQEIAN